MKTRTLFALLIGFLLLACKKENDNKITTGQGFEIYLTTYPYAHSLNLNYGKVHLDTVALLPDPMLRYEDLLTYDTLTHILTLGKSHDLLNIGNAGVYGRMFVVSIDKEPIYCGFNWPVESSVPCNWVFIEEPYESLDSLKDNEIRISFNSNLYEDPRLDRRIVDRLIRDHKVK
jgi:hypothetical protein